MNKLFFWIGFIAITLTSCEKNNTTIVNGYVKNYFTNEVIDSVKITLTDGIYAGTPPPDFKYPKKQITYTDKNGYFSVVLDAPDKSPFFWVNKIGYNFDPDWNDGASVGVDAIGYGTHSNRVYFLKPDTSFCATIINKGAIIDSMIFTFLQFRCPAWAYETNPPDDNIYVYGKNVDNNKLYFSGNGPWNTCDNAFIYYQTIAKYLRYDIKLKRNGVWETIIDSINLDDLNTNWSDYDKVTIEIK